MTKSNLLRISIISYLLTLTAGSAVVLPFIVKDNAASILGSTTEYAGYVFSFFMIGMFAMQYLNGFVVKVISLKWEIVLICVINLLCTIAMQFVSSMAELLPILVVLGLSFGAVITIPNYMIVNSYEQSARSARLNRNDMFFSIGSFFIPYVAGYLLADKLTWADAYAVNLIVLAIVFVLLMGTKLPELECKEALKKGIAYSKWTLNVYLIGIAIFFYFVSYVGFTYWLQPYFSSLGLPIQTATLGVTLFWLFYGLGCFISSFVVQKYPVHRYMIVSAIIACLTYALIFYSQQVVGLYMLISLLGLSCSTLFSSSISYGSLLLEKPSPRVVSFFITASGVGTFVGEFYSSYIQNTFGFGSLVLSSAVAMGITVFIYLYVMSSVRKNCSLTL
ncbi:MFS transporter [Francisellaceae bacterium]|nr:MFS transporter [Francisellaceae bacterium]